MKRRSAVIALGVLCIASSFALPVTSSSSKRPEHHTLPGRRSHAVSASAPVPGDTAKTPVADALPRKGAISDDANGSASDVAIPDFHVYTRLPSSAIGDAKGSAHDFVALASPLHLQIHDELGHEGAAHDVPGPHDKLELEPHLPRSDVLLQRSTHHRKRHAFRQPRTLEDEPTLIWGLPKLMWVILADIVAVFLFLSCIPLIMFLSKRRRPNFDEKEGCCPSCFDPPQPVDRMGV